VLENRSKGHTALIISKLLSKQATEMLFQSSSKGGSCNPENKNVRRGLTQRTFIHSVSMLEQHNSGNVTVGVHFINGEKVPLFKGNHFEMNDSAADSPHFNRYHAILNPNVSVCSEQVLHIMDKNDIRNEAAKWMGVTKEDFVKDMKVDKILKIMAFERYGKPAWALLHNIEQFPEARQDLKRQCLTEGEYQLYLDIQQNRDLENQCHPNLLRKLKYWEIPYSTGEKICHMMYKQVLGQNYGTNLTQMGANFTIIIPPTFTEESLRPKGSDGDITQDFMVQQLLHEPRVASIKFRMEYSFP
jgi:hypothetical protein